MKKCGKVEVLRWLRHLLFGYEYRELLWHCDVAHLSSYRWFRVSECWGWNETV